MKQKSLILMISVCLIVMMTVNVMAFNWPWSATGKATSNNNKIYILYQGKSQDVKVGEKTYNIQIKNILDKESAILYITLGNVGFEKEIINSINQIEDFKIDVKLISPKKIFKKAFVKFKVVSSEEESAGKISSQDSKCVDSDVTAEYSDGKNYYTKGYTYTARVGIYDRCWDNNVLIEYYCDIAGEIAEGKYPCPNGCKDDGACAAKPSSSGEVTYAGVLEILNKCEVVYSGVDGTNSCDEFCSSKNKKCLMGFVTSKITSGNSIEDFSVVPHNCLVIPKEIVATIDYGEGYTAKSVGQTCYCCSS